ncbi:hypothetical protein [Larkinella humicola]|uniref:Uncharacterized protein n=1 Tax=Larkinella humicola TaxID=2607654 RepID=A0A5N1J3L6_9BACT|nr:hypothetical protein [Larkinella humicola]KAA9340346.1 hypothetical protein F0P93_31330 [Larkinella humicola]
MTDGKDDNEGQTLDAENQTERKSGLKKQAKSQTTVKWSIVTEIETKSLTAKAAKKAKKGLFEWVEYNLRDAATIELTNKPKPPARPEDLATDLLEKFAKRVGDDQAQTIKTQNELIQQQAVQMEAQSRQLQEQANQLRQLTEAIKAQPGNLWEMVFGKNRKTN